MEKTESEYSVTQDTERRYFEMKQKNRGYKQQPLDELVDARMKIVRVTNEDGTVTKHRMEVLYKNPRYERYEPFVNLGKKYPAHSTKRGG